MDEPAWRRIVVSIARVHGWTVAVTSSAHSDPGIPDLTLIHPAGEVLFVELKGPNGQVRRDQRRVLEALRKAHVGTHVWRPRDRHEVENVLSRSGRQPAAPTPSLLDRRATVATIIDVVADYCDVSVDEILSESRRRAVARARHDAMALVRELLGLTLASIGEMFGRDHATVVYAIRRADERDDTQLRQHALDALQDSRMGVESV